MVITDRRSHGDRVSSALPSVSYKWLVFFALHSRNRLGSKLATIYETLTAALAALLLLFDELWRENCTRSVSATVHCLVGWLSVAFAVSPSATSSLSFSQPLLCPLMAPPRCSISRPIYRIAMPLHKDIIT